MKTILTIDIGNSHQGFALFDENERFLSKGNLSELSRIQATHKPDATIVSCVDDSQLAHIPGSYKMVRDFFGKNSFLDMPTSYTHSLGDDRIASIYYLYKLNSRDKVLIDSGTFNTLDFITSAGHLGGYILPGERVLRQSFQHGKNLRQFELPQDLAISPELPLNSPDAMAQGILACNFFSIKGLIKQQRFQNIYLTGGNCERVAEFLKSSKEEFHLMLSQDLLHRSLSYIAKRNCL